MPATHARGWRAHQQVLPQVEAVVLPPPAREDRVLVGRDVVDAIRERSGVSAVPPGAQLFVGVSVDAAATARAKRKIPAPVRDWPNLLPRESPGANALLRTPPAATPRADRDTFAARTVGGTIAVAGAQRKPRAPPSGTATGRWPIWGATISSR